MVHISRLAAPPLGKSRQTISLTAEYGRWHRRPSHASNPAISRAQASCASGAGVRHPRPDVRPCSPGKPGNCPRTSTTWPGSHRSPSHARMCVATRSRNQRSWEMTTAQPGKLQQRVLQRLANVSTSRSFVGSSSSSRLPPCLSVRRQVQAVALAAGEHAGRLLLVGALEAEAGHIGAGGHLDFAGHFDEVKAVGHRLPQVLVRRRGRRGSGRRS